MFLRGALEPIWKGPWDLKINFQQLRLQNEYVVRKYTFSMDWSSYDSRLTSAQNFGGQFFRKNLDELEPWKISKKTQLLTQFWNFKT